MKPVLLGELLLANGMVKAAEIDKALSLQSLQGGRLGEVLVRLGAISTTALYAGLAEQLDLPVIAADAIDETRVREALSQFRMPASWWLDRGVLFWNEGDSLQVASADPLDMDVREALAAEALAQHPCWHLMLPADVEAWTQRLRHDSRPGNLDARALRELAEDAPVVAFVNNTLAQALESRASDIHVEPGERECTVRFRVDGVLQTRSHLPMDRYPAIASRIKLIGGLDIAERRLPQDGRIGTRVAGREVDVRISSIPAVHGESLVLRLLPKERGDIGMHRIGMESDHKQKFQDWLQWPNGLVLVTGPTGSGKSTTLYSALSQINDGVRKLITVEDPVELRLPGVVQIQTQADIGYTFARALRSILRHDPDVIMVGEIRDRETAEIAIQAALTGHLVLATLHTNDALSAVNRLVDMGIESYLVAAALRAVMAQRLVRRLCPSCAVAHPDPDLLEARWTQLRARASVEAQLPDRPDWRAAKGCPDCSGSGYKGRVGIYELVTVTAPLQHEIAQGAAIEELVRLATLDGRRSMVEDGLIKSAHGLTTLDEVMRAASSQDES
ncbi:Flp pilus assembly complex ATPase component TadA [Paucibacter sp. DJ1R-11]|uniref:GspE/PulE family protein n=1 Tax=Paucibacter sp. DJ1R-11 TaxID=2893556 RepID=UPI0021E43DE4|nr:type II/IV secretion system protein [Paucibacter sp. DJ1R-11]MCV2364688.1 Flp pilus assembly complex ATPase component TadA [Paucibacter sp. DJ1R-11]